MKEIAEQLSKRGFEPHCFATAGEAEAYLLANIAESDEVAVGGSTTVTDMGLRETLRSRGNTVLYHSETPKEQWPQLLPRIMNAAVYICSANAISSDGRIWEIDATGNRLSALCYGPKTIYLICGMNKVVQGGRGEALARMKANSNPKNCRRLQLDTPCAKKGSCPFPEGVYGNSCICNLTLEIGRVPRDRRLHVLLVEETLGY